MHVPSSIEAEEAEEIGVEHLLRDIKDLSTGTLSNRVADRLNSLRGLQSRLLEIRDYLEEVVQGKLPVNHQIIYNLQDIFNLLPNIDLGAGSSSSSLPTHLQNGLPNGTAANGDVEMSGAASSSGAANGAEILAQARTRSRPLTIATNDQLLVMYLSSLIRAVLALHGLVNNKLENVRSWLFDLPLSRRGTDANEPCNVQQSTAAREEAGGTDTDAAATKKDSATATQKADEAKDAKGDAGKGGDASRGL